LRPRSPATIYSTNFWRRGLAIPPLPGAGRRSRLAALALTAAVGLLLAALAFNYSRPLPSLLPAQTAQGPPQPSQAQPLPWPSSAQSALGLEDAGMLAATPNARAQPIASVAKVMTALVVLQEKPLAAGEAGPLLQIGEQELREFASEKANGESVVAVKQGEQLTERQALEGLLLPSGNNLAVLLSRWVAGSSQAFQAKMNSTAASLGLRETKFADVSGLDPGTVSTPSDLVKLGLAAMKNPAFAEVVGQPQADLPVAGTVYNVNYAIGQDGITGIKTGTTPEAGAVYLFSGTVDLEGRKLVVVGVVQGQSALPDALTAGRTVLKAAKAAITVQTVVSRGQVIGRYDVPWQGNVDVVAKQELRLPLLSGSPVRYRLKGSRLTGATPAGRDAGSLEVTAADAPGLVAVRQQIPLATAEEVAEPSAYWRLTRTR
ncbi:MAG: hypothetical protein M3072_13125, partial [Candidatus Dormibacteraeota bacterium]|nr:hypothetical protein [Candidatus Dormibacteraeota bacterium]